MNVPSALPVLRGMIGAYGCDPGCYDLNFFKLSGRVRGRAHGIGYHIRFYIEGEWTEYFRMSTNYRGAQEWIAIHGVKYVSYTKQGMPWYEGGNR